MASSNIYRARPVIITGSEARANRSSNLHEKYFSSVNDESTASQMDARHRQSSLSKGIFGSASQQSGEITRTRNVKREETGQSAGQKAPKINEPQPFARTNVTKHDEIWNKDLDTSRETSDHLSPPMKYITLQTAEELWKNFDPMDVLDSASDRSDSSTDTMIMMTTEEEQKNKEKINHSLKKYEQKHVVQSGFHLDNHLGENRERTVAETNHPTQESQVRQPVKVFINQGTNIHGDLSPDDGYGTNSSSGTVSSPFSLGFPSLSTNASADPENLGTANRTKLPNGAIKHKGQTSVRDTWAVKRKARVNDTHDDTLQERLQQLAIIEEEEGSVMSENQGSIHRKDSVNQPSNRNKTFQSDTDFNMRQTNGPKGSRMQPSNSDRIKQRENMKKHDLVGNQQQLPDSGYIRNQSHRSFDQSVKNRNRNQGQDRPNPQLGHDTGSLSPVDTNSQGMRMISTNPVYPNRNVGQISVGQRSAFQNVNGGVSGRDGRKVPAVGHVSVSQVDVSASGQSNSLVVGQSNPVELGFSDVPRFGKSIVPPMGQPNVPALEPPNVLEVQGYSDMEENDGNRSPISPSLQAMRGELLEKWSDMDRNYRNYCGFDDSLDGMSLPDDIKVNYFKDKVLKNSYGNDNYYQPDSYTATEPSIQAGSAVTTSKSGDKGGTHSTSKSKIFQLLPNMFRPASYRKTNAEIEKEQNTKTLRSASGSSSDLKRRSLEPEYVNINDLDIPSSTLGRHVSVDNLHKRPVFASSRDICKLFQMSGHGQDLWSRPGSQRHSFHAMPASYRNVENDQNLHVEMRPRASSTSVTSGNKAQMIQSVENRMAVIQQRTSNGQVRSGQGLQGGRGPTIDPLAANQRAMYSQRTANSSGSVTTQTSPADSKLSTLV